ncbi:hypothetical protein AMECASPLE_013421 [Ameca splendens]|uniref:Uncharacterized protein n=1 Tax=Ameca splendens TaxID=208324 RepID=A0ABV1A8G2_9TELE
MKTHTCMGRTFKPNAEKLQICRLALMLGPTMDGEQPLNYTNKIDWNNCGSQNALHQPIFMKCSKEGGVRAGIPVTSRGLLTLACSTVPSSATAIPERHAREHLNVLISSAE